MFQQRRPSGSQLSQPPHRPQGPYTPNGERPVDFGLSLALQLYICQAYTDGLGYKTLACQFNLPCGTI